jgi:SAM-dependent methyltransferase
MTSALTANAIWHDVECGAYAADLPLWEELAERSGGPVLELGCGTGRVALHLARRGHEVVGLDRDAELLAVLAARGIGLPVSALEADARSFKLESPAALVLAPTHLLQLLAGRHEIPPTDLHVGSLVVLLERGA